MSDTPNMNLDLPTPGGDENVWDDKINAALETIDSHDHTPGKGVPVPSTALSIIEDLSMSSYALTEVAEIKLDPQVSSLSGVSHKRSLNATSTDLYFTNGNGVAVQITDGNSLATAVASPGLPTGAVSAYAGASAPSGWLIADGTAISRSTYSALFAVIGTTYGAGDGSTTFNLPPMTGRTAIGAGTYNDYNAGPLTRTLGQTIGEALHLLDTTEMPSHTHTINSSSVNNTHNHAVTNFSGKVVDGSTPTTSGTYFATTTSSFAQNININDYTHNHTITSTAVATGGGVSHNNMQPSTVLNWIIKT